MFSFLQQSGSAKRFALIAFALCIGYYALEYANGRSQMADFRVYYDASNAFTGDTQLYGVAFGVGSGFYKYSPFATIPFIPLAILPYQVASVIFYGIITLCIIGWSIWLLQYFEKRQLSEQKNTHYNGWILVCMSLFMADHIERELHLGNVNLFLLMASAVVFVYRKERPVLSGFMYGLMLLFKPHFLILLPYFAWKKQWKILVSTGATLVIGFILPSVFIGWNENIELHRQWITAIRDHNVELYESANTIYGILNRFILAGHGGSWLVIAGLAITAGLFLFMMLRNVKQNIENESAAFIDFFLLVALIPNLAHTDTEHFMWTWPLVGYVIWHLFKTNLQRKGIYIAAMVLAFIPYCLNSPDIVGKELRFLFDEGGLLGVANLVIVVLAISIFLGSQRRQVRVN